MAIRVALADDHELFLQGLRTMLEKKTDFEILWEAYDGADAVAKAKEQAPDILIMDVFLPEMNGIDATKLILQSCPNTRIIGLSMNAEEYFVMQMIKAGASGYVLKNSVFEELIQAIREVHDGKKFFCSKISELVSEEMDRSVDSNLDLLTEKERLLMDLFAKGKTPIEFGDNSSQEDIEKLLANELETDFGPLEKIGLSRREIEVLNYLPLGLTNNQIASALGIQEVTIKKHLHNIGEKLAAKGKTEILYQALHRKAEINSK